jgi:Pyruvate/2-oxoacid:ferredoxin oxidoreductase gamma subunit
MIGSPVVSNPDILIILNKVSLERFQTRLIRKGRMFFDSSLIRNPHLRNNIEPIPVPATRLAGLIGNTKSANMVMLGALIAKTNILKKSSIFHIFENRLESGNNSNTQININSVVEGINYIENTQSKNY